MARRNPSNHNARGLYDDELGRRERRERTLRRQRALFIPRLLRGAGGDYGLQGEAQDRAYQTVLRWADLEAEGHLPKFKETSIDTQFLDQIFGEGLGYRLKTTSPDAWQLEHKYSVRDVGTADAALGDFPKSGHPTVLIELKDSLTDLDRDRANGRTAVQQCWDYLNAVPSCPWGIVSNFRTIRLYHRDKGILAYEEFSLREMTHRERFNEFYCLFQREGLLRSPLGQSPRTLELLKQTQDRQKSVGDELYKLYQFQRLRLIEHLQDDLGKDFDSAIRIAQKLLDRIIFIAFCEDRSLLNRDCLGRAWRELPPFTKATNPRWQNFLALFGEVDSGGDSAGVKAGYNGSLFKHDDELDTLRLADKWTDGFPSIGMFDFSEEVNVEVLGHLFERSVTELEKLRVGGLFALKAGVEGPSSATKTRGRKKAVQPPTATDERSLSKMPKSAQRKRFGIYYTPSAFTGLIVERTIDAIVAERFGALQKQHQVDPEARDSQNPHKLLAYWKACLDELKAITVCDPACGSGAFLIRAYDALDLHYKSVAHGLAGAGMDDAEVDQIEEEIPNGILNHNLYGVDLSEQAVEITQLALWIRSARKNRKLSDLSRHIVCGNSLVADPEVDPKALDWQAAFPGIFGKKGPGGFTCVIGNPPWERVKVQDREFFSLTDPVTAGAVSAADRKKRIAAMPKANPELHASYLAARDHAQRLLDYARGSARYPLTGKGDVNLYMLFAELARSLVAPDGLVGLLVPSGIATDDTTKDFFNDLMESKRLVSLFDFENKLGIFEDVHRSYKFSILNFGGSSKNTEAAVFVFFAHCIEDASEISKRRHIVLSAADMALVNPNTKTCPIFRTLRDAELTKEIYKRIPILVDKKRRQGGNPWGIKFLRMFDQTNDAEHFHPAKVWEKKGYKLEGNVYVKGKKRALPLYEAKMFRQFDHRHGTVFVTTKNWVNQGQTQETSLVQHANPEFLVQPRWWVDEMDVHARVPNKQGAFLAFRDIKRSTDDRTMIASWIPISAVTNTAPLALIVDTGISCRAVCCLLANWNSIPLDYISKQKVGHMHMNFFIVEQLPTLPPDTYADKCPWSKRETLEHWISERVLKLSCTAEDMLPLANACGFKGSRGDGVHLWKEAERAELRAELDAAYFHLYGVSRADAEYMLSTFSNTGFLPDSERESPAVFWKRHSTGEKILEAFDRLERG